MVNAPHGGVLKVFLTTILTKTCDLTEFARTLLPVMPLLPMN